MKESCYLMLLVVMISCTEAELSREDQGLQVSQENSQYWEYHGEQVLLLGGSVEDNLFQIDKLEEHLNLLQQSGGNYVRNTMSSRDSGNIWPFSVESQTGLYNLNNWNERYWDKFNEFLRLTHEREIFVQIEVWATFDFYRTYWEVNPFNPKNNINYTSDRIKLPTEVSTHPTWCENPFFWSVPTHQNNMSLLNFQQRFVDKMLSYSLRYDHVLYCIDNETSVTSEWGKFWSEYIRKKALEVSKEVNVTEMWDPWDLNHISHRETFDHPETYSYVEISQNNHQRGEQHWINGLAQIEKLKKAGNLRPLNNVKTYGADGGSHGGGTQNGIESFIRSTLFGSAAIRFHRPPSGLGLNDTAQSVIYGMRMATDRMDFFNSFPDNSLLEDRSENEAYCRANPDKEYLVYFPKTGEVNLKIAGSASNYLVSRLEILTGEWTDMEPVVNERNLSLESNSTHIIYLIFNK